MAEIDRLLNGGLVPGFVHLFGGFPNAGKSTLLTMLANSVAKRRKVVFASSEQTEEGVETIAKRVGADSADVVILGKQRVIEQTLETIRQERPFLVVFDSLQKYVSATCPGTPGSSSQGTAVVAAIIDDCQNAKRTAIIVNQMSRAGTLKGGLDVEHDVDVVMVLAFPREDDEQAPAPDEDAEPQMRVIIVEKNRDGEADLKSYWQMKKGRMENVPARSALVEEPRKKYARRVIGGDEA
jgi:DNA repair protein RadA/Sms